MNIQDELKTLNESFDSELEEWNVTYADEQVAYIIKNYIDKRFDLLMEQIEMKDNQ